VETLITEGRVFLNGSVCKNLGTQVTESDRVTVDGKPAQAEKSVVIVMNKPRGYICTRSDTHSRSTIYDLLPAEFQNLHHVGRLDKESEGLLLLTNRGELSHRLVHPSHGVEKEYEVVLDKKVDPSALGKMVKGMQTEEGMAKAERAWPVTDRRANVILKQGLKRQIRLMFYQLGYEVERLTRTRIGWLKIKGLPVGGWRELSQAEADRFLAKPKASGRVPGLKPPRAAGTGPRGKSPVSRPSTRRPARSERRRRPSR
jgi:23S rRNA pseudouridine2605 synthase